MCQLCLTEKVLIATANPTTSLNERSEITRRCRHRDNLVLTNFLSNHSQQQERIVEEEEDQGGQEEEDELEGEDLQTREEEDVNRRNESDNDPEEEEVEGGRRLRKGRMTSYKQFF